MRLELKLAVVATRKTQREIARALEIGEVDLSRIVCGVTTPTQDQMDAIAKELGKPVGELFPETESEHDVA
jgi:transcriptional regulator with XRE-family HTH domain